LCFHFDPTPTYSQTYKELRPAPKKGNLFVIQLQSADLFILSNRSPHGSKLIPRQALVSSLSQARKPLI
jgi:hypothetical protein